MDKQEYRTKLDEVRRLIDEGDKEEAFYILDGMNWRRVHNVNALLAASVIYENEGHYDRAKDLLELAHERSPIGRMILYRLALVCIHLENYDEAKEYYDEFVEIAPHDSLQYIIAYQLAKAKGSDDITLISILEELKAHDFFEEWAYELAVLYHKTGQINKCISTCDEIILWYGDGPYVEGALELKMLYQPLDEGQQTKYKDFLKRRDGVIEVKPGEEFGGNGEILSAPIEIPEIAITNDRFNTQNLQAEIKRNIEEIMEAKETEKVSKNMEAIKELVEDIPYVQPKKEDTGPLEELSIKKEEARRIDDTLRNHFREYLEEERDGQMSLSLPDVREVEPQVAGQMTIDQIMADWQKTARAAEKALSEADELKLENEKARAIEEANRIIERLEQAKRKLDAGVSPKDILKEEYLADIPTEGEKLNQRFKVLKKQLGAAEKQEDEDLQRSSVIAQDTIFVPSGSKSSKEQPKPKEPPKKEIREDDHKKELSRRYATKRIDKPDRREREALKNQSTFKIKKLDAKTGEESGVGFEVPIMESDDIPESRIDPKARAEKLSRDATRIVSDVNDMLQKEIDRATGVLPKKEEIDKEIQKGLEKGLSTDQTQAFAEAVVKLLNEQARKEEEEKAKKEADSANVLIEKTSEEGEKKRKVGFDTMSRTMLSEITTGDEADDPIPAEFNDVPLSEIETGEENQTEKEKSLINEPPLSEIQTGEETKKEAEKKDEPPQIALLEIETGEESEKALPLNETIEEDELPEIEEPDVEITEEQFADAIFDEMPQTELTDEEREIFTYFTPINGMEEALCRVLTGARARLLSENNPATGNIIIQGGEGSGKTTLATSLVSVLQKETGKPDGNVGKIDGERLNTKDLASLFNKIRGGCLIIERAGDISRDTALELSAQMEQDKSGILVILEDARIGIERAMALNPQFSRRFSEKIVIPVLTIDELVNFGKAYSMEMGYSIDEMGVLALYDRINLIQRTDHPTNLTEVKAIVDEAIDIAEGSGFRGFLGRFGGRHYDADGNLILQEKDFHGR